MNELKDLRKRIEEIDDVLTCQVDVIQSIDGIDSRVQKLEEGKGTKVEEVIKHGLFGWVLGDVIYTVYELIFII